MEEQQTMSGLDNFKTRTFDCPGEKHYLCKSLTDCPRSCRRGWNIHWFMPHHFNEDLGMHQVSAKFVPRLLTDDLLKRANGDENLLKNVINGDETWVYNYDVETKHQSSHWISPASPHPKKAQQVHLQAKAMLLCFFNH
jgi:hypothetical protein